MIHVMAFIDYDDRIELSLRAWVALTATAVLASGLGLFLGALVHLATRLAPMAEWQWSWLDISFTALPALLFALAAAALYSMHARDVRPTLCMAALVAIDFAILVLAVLTLSI